MIVSAPPSRMSRTVWNGAVQEETNSIKTKTADQKVRIEVVPCSYAGKRLDRAQRIIDEHAGKILQCCVVQRVFGRGICLKRLKHRSRYRDLLDEPGGFLTQQKLDCGIDTSLKLNLSGDKPLAHGRDIHLHFSGRDVSDLKMSGVVSNGFELLIADRDRSFGDRFAGPRIEDLAANVDRSLRQEKREGNRKNSQRLLLTREALFQRDFHGLAFLVENHECAR